MCPSSRITLADENEYWTDEGIFMSLLNFKSGKPLPLNVTSDVNPYLYKPSDLPADLWYLCSGVKKDTECGFWLETSAPREIFSNSAILGFRTTLRFHEGRTLHGRKTDWVMQEYTITEKHNNNSKDLRALCRVFSVDENTPPLGKCIANIDVKISINMENAMDSDTEQSLIKSPKPFLDNASQMDCILMGDYLELNDLIEPGLRSSSSANSSCLTVTSEEYFDSMALLQELDNAITDQEMKESSVKLNRSTPIMSKEVVICPATSVSMRNDRECKPFTQETSKADNRNKSTSNGFDTTSSNSSEVLGTTFILKKLKICLDRVLIVKHYLA